MSLSSQLLPMMLAMMEPMWTLGPSLPTARPDDTEQAVPTTCSGPHPFASVAPARVGQGGRRQPCSTQSKRTLATKVRQVKKSGVRAPFRWAFI